MDLGRFSLATEIQATAGNNAIPILTYNSFELPKNMSANAFVSLACGILHDKIAFSGIDYTEKRWNVLLCGI